MTVRMALGLSSHGNGAPKSDICGRRSQRIITFGASSA